MHCNRNKFLTFSAAFLFLTVSLFAQKSPTFEKGQDPKPTDKKWKLVKNMSDEFKGKKLDKKKWVTSGGWIGRAPGLFMEDNIKVKNGSVHITAYKLDKPVTKHTKVFTHGGGYIGSKNASKYGYYECRMKANKTFMSSTFWFINERNEL